MIGKKEIKKLVDIALQYTKADQIEVSVFNHDQALTRFANNYIHQNVNESNTSISIRVAFGKKIGSASTNSLKPDKIKETVKWAEEIAKFQRDNEDFIAFPGVKTKEYSSVDTYVEKTAQFSNTERANAVAEIVEVAKKQSLTTFGSVSNGVAEIYIANSFGTQAYAICDDVFCNIVMSGENSTGYVQSGKRNVTELDFRTLAEVAAQKAIKSANPVEISPGQYTTIFEPLAASEFLDYLAYYAFNGKLYEEGRSYLKGKLSTKIMDERITVVDDPYNKMGFRFPFDFEGVPKKKLALIDKGVAKNVVYDSLTASKAHKKSTGHALSAPNPFGPIPLHLVMNGGNKTFDKLISETERGVLVTRFHYTNIIEPHKLTFTGMTRDGTFLIEDGEVTKGLKNFRFTENIVNCLNRLDDIAENCELVASDPGYGARFATGTVVPALKIKDFAFTSATEF
jgi:PmbA protein